MTEQQEHEVISLIRAEKRNKAVLYIYGCCESHLLSFLKRHNIYDPHTRKEIVDESVRILVSKIQTGKTKTRFQAFLYRTCRNMMLEEHRKTSKRSAIFSFYKKKAKEDITASIYNDSGLMPPQKIEIISKGLLTIDEECRKRIELRFFKKLSHKEIAKVFQNTKDENTSKVQLSRCMKKLENFCYGLTETP